MLDVESGIFLLRRGDSVPGAAELLLHLRVGGDGIAQRLFHGGAPGHKAVVEQPRLQAGVGLDGVLVTEDLIASDAGLLRAAGGKLAEQSKTRAKRSQDLRLLDIAREFELRQRLLAAGRAGIAGDKNHVTFGDAIGIPGQVVVNSRGLVALIDVEKSDVHIVARIGKVVGIAAVEGDVRLRGKHQAHIGIFFVAVKIEDAALEERDHVAAQSGATGALFLQARHRCFLRCVARRRVHLRSYRGIHRRGDVFDAHQDVQFQVGALGLLLACGRIKTFGHVIVRGGTQLVDAVGTHVMVGHHQPFRTDEGARAAVVEAHRGEANVVEPRVRRCETVVPLDKLLGKIVERPHALVSPRVSFRSNRGERGREQQGQAHQSRIASCHMDLLIGLRDFH